MTQVLPAKKIHIRGQGRGTHLGMGLTSARIGSNAERQSGKGEGTIYSAPNDRRGAFETCGSNPDQLKYPLLRHRIQYDRLGVPSPSGTSTISGGVGAGFSRTGDLGRRRPGRNGGVSCGAMCGCGGGGGSLLGVGGRNGGVSLGATSGGF